MPVTTRLFNAGTATAVAPVAAIPTTAAHFSLWNGESVGGKTYTINGLSWTTTTTAGATMIIQLLAHLLPGLQPVVAGTAAKGPLSTDGIYGGSKAVCASAVTLTASQAAGALWHAVGPSTNTAALTATIGNGQWVNTRGLYRLTPGAILSLATLGSTAAGACQLTIQWEEEQV